LERDISPGPGQYHHELAHSSKSRRVLLGHIDKEHQIFEQEVTPGPCDYSQSATTSKNLRNTLGHINPEYLQIDEDSTPGPGSYSI